MSSPKKKPGKGKSPSVKSKKKKTLPTPKSKGFFVTEKEKFLQKEYEKLTEDLQMLAKRISNFELENIFLEDEARKIQLESKEYTNYLSKYAQRHNSAIITLSDHNHKALEEISKQKEEMVTQMQEKEELLRGQLLEKENEFCTVAKAVDELQPYKELQVEQMSQIKELEREVLKMKVLYTENVRKVKSTFLQDQARFKRESQQKVLHLSKKAIKVASQSLGAHTKQVKEDNCKLRNEMLYLIRRTNLLNTYTLKLQKQNQELLQEVEYRRDLTHIRNTPPHRRHAGCVVPEEAKEDRDPKLPPEMHFGQELFYLQHFLHLRSERSSSNVPPKWSYEGLLMSRLPKQITKKDRPSTVSPAEADPEEEEERESKEYHTLSKIEGSREVE
ncbi:hypothetical protein FKM82_019746 [Ascaphus truei]|uniref:coiled-coil domain-containing protein 166-like n=1 Tax=Ascaphus truei TaxID=8439 RepID=UPI003F595F2A